MDNLFLKRVNFRLWLVKKEQEPVFEKSMGSLYNPQFLLKTLFHHSPVLSNDPYAIQTAPVFKKDHPFRSSLRPGSPMGWKRIRRLTFKDLEKNIPALQIVGWLTTHTSAPVGIKKRRQSFETTADYHRRPFGSRQNNG
jgi:hypothetical protein